MKSLTEVEVSKRGPKWSTVTIALAVIAAVAVASPALGGPSLRSLVKKEVAKQISRATGPAGPAGANGSAGAAGAAGANGAAGGQGPGAFRLEFNQPETDEEFRALGTVNELTVLAHCSQGGGARARLIVQVQSSVAGAEIEGTNEISANDLIVTPQPPIASGVAVAPGATAIVDIENSGGGEFLKSFVQGTFFTDLTSGRVISLQLYGVANDGSGRCQVHGTAVPAS